ncbi:MAG: hypothetical protein Udaeo2_26890 [Candidatus Udaeobacter sp.]|nr:MAG: hypothetical protein Udaeo2_26890 [Candidatus Udaeobacter sp.]
MAISLTPKNAKEVVGVVEMKGNTDVDNVAKVAVITNPQITGTYFPHWIKLARKMDHCLRPLSQRPSQSLCIL